MPLVNKYELKVLFACILYQTLDDGEPYKLCGEVGLLSHNILIHGSDDAQWHDKIDECAAGFDTGTYKYVSFSINICPWQEPMHLGIKVKVTSCPGGHCPRESIRPC